MHRYIHVLCMHVYMYMCICVYMYVCVYMKNEFVFFARSLRGYMVTDSRSVHTVHMRLHPRSIYTYIYIYMYTHICIYKLTHIHTCTYTYIYISMHIYVSMWWSDRNTRGWKSDPLNYGQTHFKVPTPVSQSLQRFSSGVGHMWTLCEKGASALVELMGECLGWDII